MGDCEGVVETDCPTAKTTTTPAASFGGLGADDGECESSVVQELKNGNHKRKRRAGINSGAIVGGSSSEEDEEDDQERVFLIGGGGAGDKRFRYGRATDANGGGEKELRIQIPHTVPEAGETTENEEDEDEEDDDEDDEDDDDDDDEGEGELIPEFDPDEKSGNLFTEELRAAVEEGAEFQLPPMMMNVDPHFVADVDLEQQEQQGQVRVVDEAKEVMEIDGQGLLPAATPPSAEYDGITGHLDAIAYKIYAALLQVSSYPPSAVVAAQAGEGSDQYPHSMIQEQVGDKNPTGIDEGERTPRHPRWTREETVVLLSGKRKRDEEIRALQGGSKPASATERWDSISDYCKAHGVDRDAHQCRKRWSNLAADFKKIRNWHKLSGVESYWSMRGDNRRENKLPGSFDPEVFADMETTNDSNTHKKRKLLPPGSAENVEEQHDPLASVLESSGRAMQAALARNIQAQIEAHNQNSELDRNQRKEQGDNLVGVLGLLADSLAKIADKM